MPDRYSLETQLTIDVTDPAAVLNAAVRKVQLQSVDEADRAENLMELKKGNLSRALVLLLVPEMPEGIEGLKVLYQDLVVGPVDESDQHTA